MMIIVEDLCNDGAAGGRLVGEAVGSQGRGVGSDVTGSDVTAWVGSDVTGSDVTA